MDTYLHYQNGEWNLVHVRGDSLKVLKQYESSSEAEEELTRKELVALQKFVEELLEAEAEGKGFKVDFDISDFEVDFSEFDLDLNFDFDFEI